MTAQTPLIDIRPDHWEIVRSILQKNVPNHTVWAFGSRATWKAKEYSDLDLAIITDRPLSLDVSASLSDDFSESDLPWRVDVVDWATTSESFRKIIERDKVVVWEGREFGMGNEWSETCVGDLLLFSNGRASPERAGDLPFPVYGSNGIIGYTNDTNAESGVIIIGRVGSYCGSLHRSTQKCWVTDNAIRAVAKDGHDPQFLFYLLGTLALNSKRAGSGQPLLNQDILSRIPTTVPKPAEQRAIAHILGTLDDKIELNRKQNETLEAMARALFKAWFIDFEPVRAKMEGRWQRGQSLPGLPAHLYDIFPERLAESELGEIPEGWRVFTFGDVAQQGKGAVNPGNLPREAFTHYSLPAFDSARTPVIELGVEIKSNKTPVPDGAVLVSKLNPHIPRIWQVGKAGVNAVCSTEFIVWTPKAPANSAFLYCLASSAEFNSAMRQLVTGTSNSHQRVKPDQLSGIRVFAACEAAIGECSKLLIALIEQVLQNRLQSRSLAKLRDTLLPKLVSGELRVPDAEAFLGEHGL